LLKSDGFAFHHKSIDKAYNWEEPNEVPHYWLNHSSSSSLDLELGTYGSDASLLGESPDRCVLSSCIRGTHPDTHASLATLAAQWSHSSRCRKTNSSSMESCVEHETHHPRPHAHHHQAPLLLALLIV
jgi:hypothetical protein